MPFFLRRRRPNVFDLIRENNLFTAVRDQALLLVEFDLDLEKQQQEEKGADGASLAGDEEKPQRRNRSIALLVDHLHSIPVSYLSLSFPPSLNLTFDLIYSQIAKVVRQLQERPYYLYLYLDALFERDPQLAMEYAERQVRWLRSRLTVLVLILSSVTSSRRIRSQAADEFPANHGVRPR